MSDANLSADKVRTMLAEANGRLRKASAEYFDLLEKGLSSSQLPVADQAKQFCSLMQRNVTATFELGDKLIQAKERAEGNCRPAVALDDPLPPDQAWDGLGASIPRRLRRQRDQHHDSFAGDPRCGGIARSAGLCHRERLAAIGAPGFSAADRG